MKRIATALCWIGLGAMVFGQSARTPARRAPSNQTVTSGCPAPAPPVAADSSATAGDYIELRRTACLGGCPAYRVRVSGDGRVAWVGEGFVTVRGAVADTISTIDARALVQRAADRGFWGLCARYSRGGSDVPSYFTTLSIAGHVKTVEDTGEAAPVWLRTLDADVDQTTDTHRWRHGDPAKETFGNDRLIVDTVSPKSGVTRLMRVASARDTKELGEMLADTSLDLNATDSSGWNALMYASQAGTLEAVSMLLQARADPARRSNEGETPIHAAVSSADRAAGKVRLLRNAGVNINTADGRGVTPLMLAARRFLAPGLIATMMELGADPAKRDVDGRIALDYLDEAEKLEQDPVRYEAIKKLMTVK